MSLKNYIMCFLIIIIVFIIHGKYFNKKNDKNMKIIQKIHDNLFFNFEGSGEISERIGVYNNLNSEDVVLEIGGNKGGVSEVIASILKNPLNLVVVEPNKRSCQYLDELMTKKKRIINIFNGVVCDGVNKLECSQPESYDGYCDCKMTNNPRLTDNKTIPEIEKMFNLKFNVLVIDCEGCYEHIFKYLGKHDLLKNIQKIFIEWDGKFQEYFLEKHGFILIDYIEHSSLTKGVRTYLNKNYVKRL
jgi:FkbM family methyltransferase